MESISIEKAQEFLDEHFKLFLDKKREEGYECEILIDEADSEVEHNYFYVQFCKENGCKKCYKVVCSN